MTVVHVDELAGADMCGARLSVDADGTLTLSRDGTARDTLRVPGLARDPYVAVARLDGWACLVGLRAGEIVLVDGDRLRIAGRIERLDLLVDDDAYDPGGLERIEFHALDHGAVLVESEIAIARVERDRGVTWQRVHDDVTCRVAEVGPERIVLRCESDVQAVRPGDGDPWWPG